MYVYDILIGPRNLIDWRAVRAGMHNRPAQLTIAPLN
eukprot:COSAG01_NODE_16866_length_1197_cov_1716.180328_2_plen_37_part_00